MVFVTIRDSYHLEEYRNVGIISALTGRDKMTQQEAYEILMSFADATPQELNDAGPEYDMALEVYNYAIYEGSPLAQGSK